MTFHVGHLFDTRSVMEYLLQVSVTVYHNSDWCAHITKKTSNDSSAEEVGVGVRAGRCSKGSVTFISLSIY